MAALDCSKSDFETALEHLEASLNTNRQNNKAYILKAVILKHQGYKQAALSLLTELLKTDPLDQWAKFEVAALSGQYDGFIQSSRNDAQTIIDIAFDYAEAGFYKEALAVIQLHHNNEIQQCAVPNPMAKSVMTEFVLDWLYERNGDSVAAAEILKLTKAASCDYFFPSRLSEQLVLEWVLQIDPQNTVAAFGLGNYYFNLKRHQEAIRVWKGAVAAHSNYATLYRNLGIAYWNTFEDGEKARQSFLKAVELAPNDMRIRYEFDQLRKKLNDEPKDRLASLLPIIDQIITRDDFSVELAALYNFTGDYHKALNLLENKRFHPWEGGEGQVLRQFTYACLKLGQQALLEGDAETALDFFMKSMNTPDNLGEKYHPLQAVAHINYWKGLAQKVLGRTEEATAHFMASTNEEGDFIDMAVSTYSELSYYKALSLKELGKVGEANDLLAKIKGFAETKLKEKAQIDYFATSLPLLLVFDDDMQKRNTMDAKFLIALAELGMGNNSKALNLFEEVIQINAMHIGAHDQIISMRKT